MKRGFRRARPVLVVMAAFSWLAAAPLPARQAPAEEPAAPQTVHVPDPDEGADALARRGEAQRQALGGSEVFWGFRFEDRRQESGIEFLHRIVDDVGRDFKPNHYDHGNGVLAADVDGDDRPDLYFLTQLGGNQLWRNAGGGRFEEITAEAGVALSDRVSVTGAFGDVDNDGDADLFVTTVKMGNVLFLNDGAGRFEDVTEGSGLEHVGHSSGAAFFDFDRDGVLDLLVANVGAYTTALRGRGGYYVGYPDAFEGHLRPGRNETSLLYRGLGEGRFVDVTEETGLVDEGWSGDVAIADVDGDGWQDVYLVNMQGDDHYWENQEGRRFVDRTEELFPKTPWGSMGVKFFDWNGDALPDLYLTDMHSDMVPEGAGVDEEKKRPLKEGQQAFYAGGENNLFGNAFYTQQTDGTFREVSDEIGTENYWPWGFSAGDLNADGWQDLFVASSMSFPFRYGVNSVLLNEGGERFVDAEFGVGVEPRREGATRVPWFELDCSQPEDAGHLICEGRSGRVIVTGTLGTRSSALLDLEGDGDLDVVTNEFNARPQVLVSNLSEVRRVRFLQVELEGVRSNRDGFGAVVRVVTDAATVTRRHDGSSGYLSHSALPLYFGLGEASSAQRVEVDWPSGVRQTVPGPIELGQTLRVREEVPAEE